MVMVGGLVLDGEKKRQLIELIERGDIYGLMLCSVQMYVGTYHPDFGPVVLVAETEPGRTSGVIPIPRHPSPPPPPS